MRHATRLGIIAAAAMIMFLVMACDAIVAGNKTGDDPADASISGVTVSAAGNASSVAKGGTLQSSATVTGTDNPSQAVTWTLVTGGAAAGTGINNNGLLTVASGEPKTALEVKATSAADATKSGTMTVMVTGNNTSQATLRYETVPYIPGGGSKSLLARAVAGADNLVLAAYDADSYYYLFLIGHVNSVPLAYRQAIAYNGVTPVTIGYSATNVTETSITQSVAQATENSVTDTTTHGWEAGVEIGIGFIAESKITAKYTGEISTEAMKSRSTENTYETASTKSSEITDEISVTVGDHDEPAGLYRYSLFTTTDVYYVLKTDKAKTTVKQAYTALCARPTSYWALDYEPELGGSFRKTASGDLLEVPDLVLSSLPTPTDNDLTPIPAQKVAAPVANQPAGSYQTSVTVALSSATAGAAIRYTTNGDTPTASSTLYNGPITITQNTTLKAIAIAAGMDNSTVMTETYTITEVPLQTSWTIILSSSRKITDTQTWVDIVYIPGVMEGYHNYDVEKLKAAGYAYIKMAGSFQAREIYDAWLWFDIRKGADGKGTTWYSYHDYDLAPGVSGFQTMTIPRADPYILIRA